LRESRLKALLSDKASASPRSRIVRTMSERGMLSAVEIARLTGLARSTVSTALANLRKSGIVVEVDTQDDVSRGVGRPATALTLNPQAGTCVGIHLGLAEIKVVLADVSHSIIDERIIELGLDYLPERVTAVAKKAVAQAYRDNGLDLSGLLGVGVSVSGPVSPDGQVQRGGILPNWVGVNIRDIFGRLFERSIYVDNESNCAAVAEMMWGAAVGHRNFILFKIDLGVGGAIVVDGQVVTGAAGGAGEFGHVSIDPNGDLCRCGNRGCLEITASFNRPLAQISKIHNRPMTMDDVIALAESGDLGARRMIEDTGEVAGRGLGQIGTILNPKLIIIGGRMALAGDILLAPLIKAFEKHTLIKHHDVSPAMRTTIRIGKFTENDALLGAVGLVLRGHGNI
jgi:predicted NBD/HSP70 family sugar kinase/DNA-binding CsgD family transcriptional regulator